MNVEILLGSRKEKVQRLIGQIDLNRAISTPLDCPNKLGTSDGVGNLFHYYHIFTSLHVALEAALRDNQV